MRLTQLDLNLLVVFDAIIEEGNLTRAAHKLHLTQPAISHALARLRDALGDPLFVRSGRTMVATPHARSLSGPVREALRTLERGLVPQRGFEPRALKRTFVLALRDVLELELLPPLVAAVHAEAPDVDLASVRVARRDLEKELAAGTVDLALDVPHPVGSAVRHVPVVRDHLVVLARPGHPEARGTLSMETYLRQGHVLASSRRKGPGLEDLDLHRMDKRRRIVVRCQSYAAACRVVRATDLLLTIPAAYARTANGPVGNQVLPLPWDLPGLDLHLFWHAAVDDDPANRWLRDHVLAVQRGSQRELK